MPAQVTVSPSIDYSAQGAVVGGTFLGRVSQLPVVTSAVGTVATFYTTTKSKSPLVKSTLETVESTVTTLTAKAKPIIESSPIVNHIDTFACRQLDTLEREFPALLEPTDKLVAEGRRIIGDTVRTSRARIEETARVAVHTSAVRLTQIREPTEKLVKDAVTAVDAKVRPQVEAALSAVEKLLPEEEEEAAPATAEATIPTRVKLVSTKVQRRVYGRALSQLQHVQLRSQEALKNYHFTVDLIKYAQDNLDTHAKNLKALQQQIEHTVELSLAKGKESAAQSIEYVRQRKEVQTTIETASRLAFQLRSKAAELRVPESVRARYDALYATLSEAYVRAHAEEAEGDDEYVKRARQLLRLVADANKAIAAAREEATKVVNTAVEEASKAVTSAKGLAEQYAAYAAPLAPYYAPVATYVQQAYAYALSFYYPAKPSENGNGVAH